MGQQYDYIIIGSGFGGAVSALRLSEKGYSVLVIEKGKWYKPKDFPKTNWNLKKWLWIPFFRFFGIMKFSFFRHLTILSGFVKQQMVSILSSRSHRRIETRSALWRLQNHLFDRQL